MQVSFLRISVDNPSVYVASFWKIKTPFLSVLETAATATLYDSHTLL
jgi:hypothetical protein